jgi:hypothetical protein
MYKILFFLFLSFVSYSRPLVKQVLVNGKPYGDIKNSLIYLEPADEDIMIEFESEKTDQTAYLYRLSGGTWYPLPYPVVHYAKLAGGSYTLEIKASGNNFSDDVTSLTIIVKEAFWQKWWFWPLIGLYLQIFMTKWAQISAR